MAGGGQKKAKGRVTGTISSSAKARERDARALRLRTAGASYQQIADELGYGDKGNAHRAVQRRLRGISEPDAAALRELEAERLDAMQRSWWQAAVSGDEAAAKIVMRVIERRARMFGLDHADGIAEAQLRIEQDKVRLMAMAVSRVFDALDATPEQREKGTRVLLAELRAAEAAEDAEHTVAAEVVSRETPEDEEEGE